MPGCRISACGAAPRPGEPPPPPTPLSFPPPSSLASSDPADEPGSPPSSPPPQPPPQPQPAAPGTTTETATAEKGAGRGLELQRWRPGGHGAAGAAAAGSRALELAEARRRLLEVEGRRRVVSELESRVQHLHRVFLAAELRLAHRAESLSRLGGSVSQAELYLAAHGQRAKKGLRRGKRPRPPALLASALGLGGCVPWAAGRLRRAGAGPAAAAASPEPDSPFRRSPPRGPASPQH
ncbi:TMF-regulated nuclear protein 1 [Vombatus ursinus]|uniref:TMF-regulated nuclear protein 1 n=1 Tax=Vombatus ursinus TaxID=29139 RepID=UPI000FFDA6B6|nr:TMF-regulated nuclear protein 1 [Vombatus ursinus]XP_027720763.1 TMF-regulated nuclear protein 1 [Vombatus ursinus]XP_027720764.1 TMF-regulated nuclear protein 1 [Vombatus ursinus]XP_027720765.1 TMF-regulated nuclear protein 1 [Vombatus ursinus]XP_027720766.1 TMF-regulated nuclear protein 1 [Vombatus ursinus]XP_027720767.1 TMF-regulated nuclear protein 1 [Vombatus ursinus]